MAGGGTTVQNLLQQRFESMTRAERQLVNSLLENWPVSGLASITAIAQKAEVSTPTVARTVKKIGFNSFPEFQAAVRTELEATISNPIVKHERWAESAPDAHILNRFADKVMQNLRQTLAHIDAEEFDGACAMIAEPGRSVFVAGGRITHALAEYLYRHLQMLRSGVSLVPTSANTWPHYLMDMSAGDVLVIFDIRRYENDLLKLAEIAKAQGVEMILITDQWGSPISKHVTHCFNCRIEAPSAWDSSATLMVLIETMIAQIQASTWKTTQERMRGLESLFDETGMFRKFS